MSSRNAITTVKCTNICVFCRISIRGSKASRGRAREHVFPAWALNQFKIKRESIEFSPMEAVRDDYSSLQLSVQTAIRKFNLNSFLLGADCSDCNNGWISRLETRVKPTLEVLVEDTSAKPGESKALKKWAVKTATFFPAILNHQLVAFRVSMDGNLLETDLICPKESSYFTGRLQIGESGFPYVIRLM